MKIERGESRRERSSSGGGKDAKKMVRAWLNLPARRWVCAHNNGGGQAHFLIWEEVEIT